MPERWTGWSVCTTTSQPCSPTGSSPHPFEADPWEPDDGRLSRPVLREPGGETPPGYSPWGGGGACGEVVDRDGTICAVEVDVGSSAGPGASQDRRQSLWSLFVELPRYEIEGWTGRCSFEDAGVRERGSGGRVAPAYPVSDTQPEDDRKAQADQDAAGGRHLPQRGAGKGQGAVGRGCSGGCSGDRCGRGGTGTRTHFRGGYDGGVARPAGATRV